MLDMVFRCMALFLLIFCGGQVMIFIGLVLWVVWIDAIKPRMIREIEIDRMAGDIVASHADPEREALARHERAWYCSDGAGQTYWWRVRKAVKKRLA